MLIKYFAIILMGSILVALPGLGIDHDDQKPFKIPLIIPSSSAYEITRASFNYAMDAVRELTNKEPIGNRLAGKLSLSLSQSVGKRSTAAQWGLEVEWAYRNILSGLHPDDATFINETYPLKKILAATSHALSF